MFTLRTAINMQKFVVYYALYNPVGRRGCSAVGASVVGPESGGFELWPVHLRCQKSIISFLSYHLLPACEGWFTEPVTITVTITEFVTLNTELSPRKKKQKRIKQTVPFGCGCVLARARYS